MYQHVHLRIANFQQTSYIVIWIVPEFACIAKSFCCLFSRLIQFIPWSKSQIWVWIRERQFIMRSRTLYKTEKVATISVVNMFNVMNIRIGVKSYHTEHRRRSTSWTWCTITKVHRRIRHAPSIPKLI